jgi:hypothetical protein
MKEQLAALGLTALQTILLPLFALVATWAGIRLQAWLKEKVKNERIEGILVRLETIVEAAVKEVAQTYVSNLTEVTPAALEQARERALESIRSHLGSRGIEELKTILGLNDTGAAEKLVVTMLEAKVHDLKMFGLLNVGGAA